MPADSKQDYDYWVAKLKVLAESTRFEIAKSLLAGPMNVGELRDQIGAEATLLSHHLRTMKEAGLIVSLRDGKHVIYSIKKNDQDASGCENHDVIDRGCCHLSFADGCESES